MSRSSAIDNDQSINLQEEWLEEYRNLELQLMRIHSLDSAKVHEVVNKIRPLVQKFGILMSAECSDLTFQESMLRLKKTLDEISDDLSKTDPYNSIAPIQQFLFQCQYWMDAYSSRGHFVRLPNEVLSKIGSELPTKTLSDFQKTSKQHFKFFQPLMRERQLLKGLKISCGPHQTFLYFDNAISAVGGNTAGQLNVLGPQIGKLSKFQLLKTRLEHPEDKVIDIVSGATHTLFRTKHGNVYVSGWNPFGQCGIGEDPYGITLRKILFSPEEYPDHIKQMATTNVHSLFLTEQGNVYGCGYNGSGQLSGGLGALEYRTPQKIHFQLRAFNDRIDQVAAGSTHSVFLTMRGDVYICGEAIINGRTANRLRRLLLPTELLNDRAIKVRVGNLCTFLLTKHGRVYACGINKKGELGTENGRDCSVLTLVFDHPEDPAIDLQIGDDYSLVLTKSGQLYGCGDLWLSQVPSSNTFCKIPVALQDTEDCIVKIAAGHRHAVLLTDSGNFYVAGSNRQGEIGLGSSSEQNSFVKLFSASEIQSLLAGSPGVIQESARSSLPRSRI